MTIAASSQAGTFAALRNRNYRIYFIGQLASTSGTWMQSIAQGWLVFQLTHSAAWLGIVACATGLPLLVLSPVAGVIVERFSRQKTMIVTQAIQMILAFILAALVFAGTVQIWEIVVLAILLGVSNAVDSPARFAITADLVEREHLSSGITLNAILFNGSRVIGPAAAGLALATLGAGWCFFLNGLSFIAVIASLVVIHVKPVQRPASGENFMSQLREGVAYARNHQLILPMLLFTANAGLIGIGVLTLFPAYSAVVLHSPTDGYALVSAANGLGAVVTGLLMSWFARRVGLSRAVVITAILAAVSMALFAYAVTIPTATVISFVFGIVLITQFVGASTLIQIAVPNAFRGRVLALYSLAFSGLTPFGALALGLIANNIGVLNTFILSGVLSGIFSALILFRWPALWRRQSLSTVAPSIAVEEAAAG